MASSGKKGKKKGTVISLQSFLANGDIPTGTTQVTKKVRNLEGEESDDGINSMPLVFQLPTAPRANRMFDDDSVPHNPPYIAYLTNLPFDAKEEDLHEFFGPTPIISLRLPREEGESGRVRGFGYVEFENRDDLINTLSLPDPSIKGRRIRIEISNESDHQNSRHRGSRRGFEGLSNSGENRDSTNWRRENITYSNDTFDRGGNRERKNEMDDKKMTGSWRSGRPFANHKTSYNKNDAERMKPNTLVNDDHELERPKLNLKPRTLPLAIAVKDSDEEENRKVKSADAPSQKVFGSAKPVDTATRETEIEERISEARRQRRMNYEVIREDIQSEKTSKDDTNYNTSWRRKNDASQNNDQHGFDTLKQDNPSFDRDDSRQTKSRHLSARIDKSIHQRDETKSKRYTKNDHIFQKNQESSDKIVLQTSNKYSGLDDEASD